MSTDPEFTVSGVIAQTLARHLRHCFGLMGNGNAYLLDALAGTDVPFVAVRHEAGAVVAADAYYRACGRIAAATTTYGAGYTNTVTALAEAVRARTPLLLVTGDQPSTGARPWDVDQPGIAAAVGARTFVVGTDDAAAMTVAALQYALDHRAPVVLSIPYDLAAAGAGVQPTAAELIMPAPLAPDRTQIPALAGILDRAQHPLVLAGRGAWLSGASDVLARLAHRIGALTATSAGAPGVIGPAPDGLEVDLGICGGFADDDAAKLINSADVVLVAGARLNPFTMRHQTALGSDATVIQLDLADQATHPSVSHYLRGDVRLSAEALLAELGDAPVHRWRDRAANRSRHRDPGTGLAADGRLDPRSVAYRLNQLLPADRTVVSDGGHFIGWAPTYWDLPEPNRLILVGTEFQAIGMGFPSAVGAAAALPESTVVLTTGDGGGLMALADLDSMIRTVRRGVVVVWNDGYYGAELHQYGSLGLSTAPMRIRTADFAALGRALGAAGAVINTPDDLDQLARWLDAGSDGVFVADCRVSPHIRAPYMTTQLSLTS
ncbi:thiamine pyrophosphate-binding protein [Microlunatus elymi]|uniref:Thiamine pyrophosphate-binding protein n=1 Tax=Microlunatus elymi TaxID=2596828 RepID=A0A516Q1V0_9ACTN|nr:thiamine pyrophosphate-binding protein [Microlunatus elymi]QDP97378.1 thiamine pyrophosphate-binding protein [Microlunatus elymi]